MTKHKIEHALLISTLVLGLASQVATAGVAVSAADTTKDTTATKATSKDKLADGLFRATSKAALTKAIKEEVKNGQKTIAEDFWNSVTAQLKAQGIDTDGLTPAEAADDTVRVTVTTKGKAGINKVKSDDPTFKQADAAEEKVLDSQEDTVKAAEKLTGNKVQQEYGYLVKGFSIDAKVSQLDKLEKLDGVKKVEVATVSQPQDTSADEIVQAVQAWDQQDTKGEGMVVAIIDSGMDASHKDFRLSDDSTAKISKADAEAQIKDFGYGVYKSAKVPFAHNYADNNDTLVHDTTGEMHGQHVAGIVGANGENPDNLTSVVGVAPEAQLLDMKVFSNSGYGVMSDTTVQAIEDAVKLGADVMNMSFGADDSDANVNDMEVTAVENAAKAGVVSAISAGNSGVSNSHGYGDVQQFDALDDELVGAPAVADDAITVASSDNTKWTSFSTVISTDTKDLFDGVGQVVQPATTLVSGSTVNQNFPNRPVVVLPNTDGNTESVSDDIGTGIDEDYEGQTVKDKIVVVSRGGNSFAEKKALAYSHMAAGLIVVNNADSGDGTAGIDGQNDLPTIFVSKKQGQVITDAIKAEPDTYLHFGHFTPAITTNATANQMSYFTSWGPNTDLNLKPDLTAPGGHLWSTANDNAYQDMSGTSMASPVVAGSVALVLQKFKQKGLNLEGLDKVKAAKIALMNTANPVLDSDHDNAPSSPRQQGAGIIQISDAMDATVSLTHEGNGNASLKEIGQTKDFTVKLTNNGSTDVSYTYDDFGGVYTKAVDDKNTVHDKKIAGATITADADTFTVKAGETKEVTLTLSLPDDFDDAQWAEGFIGFKSNTAGSPDLSMAYNGFYGDWDGQKIFDEKTNTKKTQVFDNMNWLGNYLYTSNSTQRDMPLGLVYDFNYNYWAQRHTGGAEGIDGSQIVLYDENYVAMSPNGDGLNDGVKPYFSLIRNADTAVAYIKDDQGNTLRRLTSDTDLYKNFIDGSGSYNTANRYINVDDYAFDGTVYNSTTGKNELLPDGQYTYAVDAKIDADDAQTQTLEMPFKIDTTKPTADNIKLEKRDDGWHVTGTVKDNLSGFSPLNVMGISINGVAQYAQLDPSVDLYDDYNNTPGVASPLLQDKPLLDQDFDIKVEDSLAKYISGVKNDVQAVIIDNAGNAGTGEAVLDGVGDTDSNSLTVFNIYDGEIDTDDSPYYNKKDQTYTIFGAYKNDFYLNGQLVEIKDDGTFEAKIDVTKDVTGLTFSQDPKGKVAFKKIRFGFAKKPVTTIEKTGGKWLDLTDGSQIYQVENKEVNFDVNATISGTATGVVLTAANVDSGGFMPLTENFDAATGKYTATMPMMSVAHSNLSHEGLNEIDVAAYNILPGAGEIDGNADSILVNQTDQVVKHFDNLNDNNLVTLTPTNAAELKYDAEAGVMHVTGTIGNDEYPVEEFTILGNSTDWSDAKNQPTVDPTTHKFTYDLPVDGDGVTYHTYRFKLKDDGKDDYTYGYFGVATDMTFPSIDLNTGDNWQASTNPDYDYEVWTNKDELDLSGTFSDNLTGYQVKIGSDEFYHNEWNQTLTKKWTLDGATHEFATTLPLKSSDDASDLNANDGDTDNVFYITSVDEFANETTRRILVHSKKDAIAAPVVKASNTALTNEGVLLTATAADGTTLEYSFDGGQTWNEYHDSVARAINGDTLFRATDKYGNTATTTFTVANIVNKIAAKPTAALSEYDEDSQSIVLTLGYDSELSEAAAKITHLRYSTDDGKTWKDYTEPLTITETTNLLVQSYDDAGNESAAVEVPVQIKTAVDATKGEANGDATKDDDTKDSDANGDATKDDNAKGDTAADTKTSTSTRTRTKRGSRGNSSMRNATRATLPTLGGTAAARTARGSRSAARSASKKNLPQTGEQLVSGTLAGIITMALSFVGLAYFGGKKRNEEK